MPQIAANGVSLEYEAHGDPENPPLLLIMGLGAQMTLWPIELIDALVARGHYVIRYDNRDIGLSTKFTHASVPDLPSLMMTLMSGKLPALPYTLKDMADDAAALLTALGIDKAHVVGASMGGMIAQLVAIHHGERVASLTSIMSTTGNPMLPPAKPEAMAALMERPTTAELTDVLALGLRTGDFLLDKSKGYVPPPVMMARLVGRTMTSKLPSIWRGMPWGMQRASAVSTWMPVARFLICSSFSA